MKKKEEEMVEIEFEIDAENFKRMKRIKKIKDKDADIGDFMSEIIRRGLKKVEEEIEAMKDKKTAA